MLTVSVQVTDLPRLFLIDVPVDETPAMHIRNALQSLSLLKEGTPAFWACNPELGQAAVHATAALMVVEHSGPLAMTLEYRLLSQKVLTISSKSVTATTL